MTEVLKNYRFTGKIVLWKAREQYGFLRSEQIPADVFFSHFHCQGLGNSKAEEDLWGKFAQFQIEDIGRKSVEGRQVVVMESDPGPSFLTGVLTKWVKTGCLIRVASRPELNHNRIFAPHSQCSALNMKVPSSNVAVRFKIHMDKFHRVEAKEVTLAGLQEVADCTKISPTADCGSEVQSQCAVMQQDFTNEIMSKDLIKDIGGKNSESLANFFESNVKLHFKEFVHQRVAAKIVMAVICRVAQTGGGKLEEKICRMMKADFLNITSTKQGCAVVQTALEKFSKTSKVLLAEQLVEVGEVEDFVGLWTHGTQIFISMLELMEDSSLTTVGLSLLGSYEELACHINHYKPVRALVCSLVNSEVFPDILQEMDLVQLSCDRFGHHITTALLECVSEDVKDELIKAFQGKIAQLSVDPVCHSVIVACIKAGTAKQQSAIIEEVCTVATKQADMDLAKLLTDKRGHEVVLAMLEVSRHKQIHNVLKGKSQIYLCCIHLISLWTSLPTVLT